MEHREHLIIYGVFDRWANDRCVMVGSTIRPLLARARSYKNYKWFQAQRYEHRSLWEGDVADDEMLSFLRSAKEVMWIARMKTWFDQGGRNQCNPVKAVLGNMEFFSETVRAAGRASAFWRKQNPDKAFKICSDGGKQGGRVNADKPGYMSFVGRSANPENKRAAQLRFSKEHPKEAHARAVKRGRAGGCALKGHLTDEARLKMSLAKKGKPGPRKGVVVNFETRQKMRKSALNRKKK